MAGPVDRDSGLLQTSAAAAVSPYQLNVNRTKTRKWVEAKTQSYDGDDWGAADFEPQGGLQHEPVPSLPTDRYPLTAHHVTSARSERSSGEHMLPSIQVSTDRNKLPSSESFRSVSSPISSHSIRASDASLSDPYSPDEKLQRRSTLDPLPDTDKDAFHSAVPISSDMSPSKPKTEDRSHEDDFTSRDSGADVASLGERSARRDSVSPQLPDVARMSSFGADFFDVTPKKPATAKPMDDSTGIFTLSPTEPKPAGNLLSLDAGEASSVPTRLLPLQQSEPTTVQNEAEETPKVDNATEEDRDKPAPAVDSLAQADAPELPVISYTDPHADATAAQELAHIQARPPLLQPDLDWPSVPPLKTPSPRPSEAALDKPQASRSSSTGEHNQPALAERYPKPRPVQRKPTNSTITPSSVKDSDALSEEILRSLSPSASSSGLTTSADDHQTMQPASPEVTRDSTYTLGDYNDYWDDKAAPLPPARPSKVPLDPQDAPTDGTELRRRFSWEVDETEAVALHHVSTSSEAREPAEAEARRQMTPTPSSAGGDDNHVAAVTRDVASGGWAQPAAPDPPSPLSVASDTRASVAGPDSKRPSLVDDKAVAQAVSNLSSPTPPPEPPAVLSSSPPVEAVRPKSPGLPAQTRLMAFREVMGMPNVNDRIAKFNETRDHVAITDSGLDAWLASVQAQYPEYAQEAAGLCQPAYSSPSSASSQQPATQNQQQQQPYYQQYLNASAPNTSHSGRSRLAGLPIPSQVTGSSFGHPSNQIGTKSKEFMHSAGKMGKGLLSKGKSKLRGSGDKFAPQGEASGPRTERRTSWALSLGRSRADETVPHAAIEPSLAWRTDAFQGCRDFEGSDQQQQQEQQQPVRPRHVSTEPDVPRPEQEAGGRSTAKVENVAADHTPEGWVLVASPGSSAPDGPGSLAEEDDREAPKRISSFVGLPPIRRSSTFGLTSRAKRTNRLCSLKDDDNEGNARVDDVDSNEQPDLSAEAAEPLSLVPSPVMEIRDPMDRDKDNTGPDVFNFEQDESGEVEPPARVFHPLIPLNTSADPPQSPIPSLLTGDWKLEESHLSEPLHSKTRHRPGTGNSQQQAYCEYDKETGLPILPVPRQAAPYASPPSSAHRYPGLFPYPPADDVQRPPPPRSQTWGQPEQRVHHAARPRAETAFAIIHRDEVGGGQHRGRSQQRADMSDGGASLSGHGREPRKRQSGFFSSLAGRISTSRDRGSLSMAPASPRRPPSSSSLLTDQASAAASQHETRKKKKKRFSNLTALTSLKDMLHGTGHEQDSRSPAAHPPHGLDRSSTTSSFDLAPPQPMGENGVERRRRRRGSVTDMITGMLGRRPGSRAGEPAIAGQVEPQRDSKEYSPASDVVGPPGCRPHASAVQPGMKAAAVPTVTVRQVAQRQARPSPLGIDAPVTNLHLGAEAGRRRQRACVEEKPPKRRDGGLALAAFGAAHEGAVQADVSPDVSVISDAHGDGLPVMKRRPLRSVSSDETSDHGKVRAVLQQTRHDVSPPLGGPSAIDGGNEPQWRLSRAPPCQPQVLQQRYHVSHRSESALSSSSSSSQQQQQTDSRWKMLKSRISAQALAPNQNRAGGDNTSGLKVLGMRKVSEQRETRATAPFKDASPSPRVVSEPLYERVPLPRSYDAVQGVVAAQSENRTVSAPDGRGSPVIHGGRRHDEERVATEARSGRRHDQQEYGASGSPWPRQSPQQAARDEGMSPSTAGVSSPESQRSPAKADAVSPMLYLPSPPLSKAMEGLLSPSTGPSSLRAVDHQISMSSLVTRSEAEAEPETETEREQVKDGRAAELDDTAERYIRSRRLESQEEKIAYRIEDGDDFVPQMSATSYPGQEWSPYGALGYEDWRED
ncbi:hypothetical protein CP533_0140 [Ophiocordyceps camponoti-saundersi (nom. inval.)]|nr:hypothetical protein CP533_0140 [Ophiocordyceps camponoti-saundersi (nom. inval.)]